MQKKFVVQTLKTRLDKYLAKQIPNTSRSQIQRGIEAGKVFVNGEIVTEGKFVVRRGEVISYRFPAISSKKEGLKPSNTSLKVLYNDHDLLIIDKPAGLVVHPGAGFTGETLASALLYNFKDIKLVGEEGRPGIVHRLDKDTSGVILVAKTQAMYEYLKDAFAERKVKKEYIALVRGRVEKPAGKIDLPIGKSKTDFRKMDTKNMKEPKEAVTEYKGLEYLSQRPIENKRNRELERVDEYTLLLVRLHTGRTHQIRVHMKALGHPLMGDALYGGKKTELAGLYRQFLHATKIEVRLPDNTWIEAESGLADDLKDVLINLGSHMVK